MHRIKQYLQSFLFGVGVGFGLSSIASLALPAPLRAAISQPLPAAAGYYPADLLSATSAPRLTHPLRALPAGVAAGEVHRQAQEA